MYTYERKTTNTCKREVLVQRSKRGHIIRLLLAVPHSVLDYREIFFFQVKESITVFVRHQVCSSVI